MTPLEIAEKKIEVPCPYKSIFFFASQLRFYLPNPIVHHLERTERTLCAVFPQ